MGSHCWSSNNGFRVSIDKKHCHSPCIDTGYLFSNATKVNRYSFCETKFKLNLSHSLSRTYTSSHLGHCSSAAESPNSSDLIENSPRSDGHLWSALEIAEAVGGEVVQWGPSGTIAADTRKLLLGQWYFALIGQKFDGHSFIDVSLATEKGCVGVIGNRVCSNWPHGFIKLEGDTMLALEKMARYARDRFRGLVIGLTGSVGKTTTRTMIALALESLGKVYQTHRNFNAIVGVSLTLVGIPPNAVAAVVELGMSHAGEILDMARICRPGVRVLLNVGHSHMENFGSLDDTARAKGELLLEAEPGDVCVLNADDPLVMGIPVPVGVKKVLFGRRKGCDVRLVLAESIAGGCAVRVILESQVLISDDQASSSVKKSEMVEFILHSMGLHLAMNACAAAAVAVSLGEPLHQIGNSLSKFKPVDMRFQIEVSPNGITIINDTYNASPTSMTAAINSLVSIDCHGKRVAILGDMLELGEAEAWAHQEVLKLCCDSCIDIVVLAGERFLSAARSLELVGSPDIIWEPDSASLMLKVSEFVTPTDVVLVKGSRGMEMERVVEAIKEISS